MSCSGPGCTDSCCHQPTQLTGLALSKTLARQLVGTVDCIRDLNTKFGIRPYIVRIIRVKWAGGDRGDGPPAVVSVLPLLPTPKMEGMGAVDEMVRALGTEEAGTVSVSEISGRYTEEMLRGQDPGGNAIPDDDEVFWEVELLRPDAYPSEKRRFTLSGAPEYLASKVQWRVRLARAYGDRERSGAPH